MAPIERDIGLVRNTQTAPETDGERAAQLCVRVAPVAAYTKALIQRRLFGLQALVRLEGVQSPVKSVRDGDISVHHPERPES
jgi:hypothetical protein